MSAPLTAKQLKETNLHLNQDAASHSSSHGEEEEIFFTIPEFALLKEAIENEDAPIAKRMRTCFLLKQLGDPDSIACLISGLSSPSVLLAHECAYVLGQLQTPLAVEALQNYLINPDIHPIVRHECAEALAAIGDDRSWALLESLQNCQQHEVADTCKIAVEKGKWLQNNKGVTYPSKFYSVDPAPSQPTSSVPALLEQLLSPSLSLFQRYRAMFALRDEGSADAVQALAQGFGDASAVFRHEIAYVMGQLQHPAAVESLKQRLLDEQEHPMVRHEAAEALGAIADEQITPLLEQFRNDPQMCRIVRESCDVALDLVDYWNSDEVCTAVKPDE